MPTRPEVILGPQDFDDAGIIDLGDGRHLVQTVDFFPAIVDDPYDFGQIAAANALSDIYAMGALPFSVLNLVCFPGNSLPMQVLGDILAGGASKIQESGAALLGGHSINDKEVKYGLAVTGLVMAGAVLTKAGARPGDRLVLTKPLGMGALSTAIKKDKATAEAAETAIRTMATLNAGAARAVKKVGVHAVTDITGFGLLGHAAEMARASRVTLSFSSKALPFTLGATALAADGLISGAAHRNRAHLGDTVHVEGSAASSIADLAFDSETSGGLLVAVSPTRLDELLAALRDEGTPCAVDIGEVLPPESELLVMLGR